LETAVRAGRKEWIGLAVLALPTLLVSVDVFVMLLALPHLSEALHASPTEQLWIMDVYGFLLAGFMITMGTVADRIGKRRLLLVGAAAFGAASLIAAFAPTAPLLIAARALLGVAGATLAPSTLGLISTLFVDARQRGIAIGIWLACFMGGATMGPLVGGVLLEHFWWGSVFLLGVPVMLLLLVLAPMFLPESRTPSDRRLDLASVGLSLAAILSTVWGVKHLAVDGPAVLPLAAVAAGALLGTVFVRRQRQLPEPLVDLALFRNRVFGTALGAMFAGTMLTGAVMFLVAQHMQLVVGLSPLAAGIALVPAAVCSGISFLVSPLLARRTGAGYLIAGGLGVTTDRPRWPSRSASPPSAAARSSPWPPTSRSGRYRRSAPGRPPRSTRPAGSSASPSASPSWAAWAPRSTSRGWPTRCLPARPGRASPGRSPRTCRRASWTRRAPPSPPGCTSPPWSAPCSSPDWPC
jgi:DHA2 family multidrug resistance protein-like MFS transporter